MKTRTTTFLAGVLLFTALASPADAGETKRDVSMPELIFSGLANPFPAAYYFSPDRRLLSFGVGKDSQFFLEPKEALSAPAPVSSDEQALKHAEYLFRQLPRDAGNAQRYRLFFLTIHPSMGRSQLCEELLEQVRGAIKADKNAKNIDLVILQASG